MTNSSGTSSSVPGVGEAKGAGGPGGGGGGGDGGVAVESARGGSAQAGDRPLGLVRTALSPAEIVERLTTASKRGRLAGFQAGSDGALGQGGVLFRAAAFGSPFDGELIATVESAKGAGGATRLRFQKRMLRLWPVGTAAVLVASVWPGVVLTESLIATLFVHSTLASWTPYWYLPLTVPFVPVVWWQVMGRSRKSIAESAHATVAKIAAELGGTVELG